MSTKTAKKPVRKTAKAKRTESPARSLWRARDYDDFDVGVLVTEANDVGEPIALVMTHPDKDIDDAIQDAYTVLDDPTEVERNRRFRSIDLRDCCRPDSKRPLPAWMFGLRLTRIVKTEPTGEEIPWLPFCPMMLEAQQRLVNIIPRPPFKHIGEVA